MNELLKLHKQMYDVRWSAAEGDPEQLEKEFMTMTKLEGVDLEKVNEMLEQLYIPPYSESLPQHLKTNQHGGKREGAGRPSVGSTKRVALTLPDETWEEVEQHKKKWDFSMSQTIRRMIEEYLLERDGETSGLKCPHCTSYHTYLLNEEVVSNKDKTLIKASYTCNRCNNIFYADHWNNEVKINKK